MQNTTDGSIRVKFIDVKLAHIGVNLPSEYELQVYAQAFTNPSTPDSVLFDFGTLSNLNLYSDTISYAPNNIT